MPCFSLFFKLPFYKAASISAFSSSPRTAFSAFYACCMFPFIFPYFFVDRMFGWEETVNVTMNVPAVIKATAVHFSRRLYFKAVGA